MQPIYPINDGSIQFEVKAGPATILSYTGTVTDITGNHIVIETPDGGIVEFDTLRAGEFKVGETYTVQMKG